MISDYFCNDQNPHHEFVVQALRRLQSDKDRDVRYYASLRPRTHERQVDKTFVVKRLVYSNLLITVIVCILSFTVQ